MTDNEIIKALECCLTEGEMMCNKCPFKSECIHNPLDDIKAMYSLDLINRQKAEIERLTAEQEEYPFKCKVGNNSEIHSKSIQDYDKLIADISSEAIKDFAERLKNKSELLAPSVYAELFRAVSVKDIDTLVKEMTESESEKNE